MNKDKSEQQSQQGVIENWRDGWRDYCNGDIVDPEPFIEFVLKKQAQKTRKETLEEGIEAIKTIPLGGLFGSQVIEKLQSLINNQ